MIGFESDQEAEPVALAAPVAEREVRRCACGSVTLGDDLVHTEGACRTIPPAPDPAAMPFPPPDVSSRAPWDGSGAPLPVLKVASVAAESGWTARVQRSKGAAPHATTGRPGVAKWRYAVVLSEGEGGACAYAVYDADGGKWGSVMLWSSTRPWFPFASITDLGGYMRQRGDVPDEWFVAIREREAGKASRRKAAKPRPARKDGLS